MHSATPESESRELSLFFAFACVVCCVSSSPQTQWFVFCVTQRTVGDSSTVFAATMEQVRVLRYPAVGTVTPS